MHNPKAILIVAVSLALAAPCTALAGSNKGGGGPKSNDTPKESVNLNYGKVEQSYAKQQPAGKKGPTSHIRKSGGDAIH